METKKIKIEEIKPHKKNPKKHDVELIAKSIKEFQIVEPIVIDEQNVILVGHGRLKALKELKQEEVEVIVKRGLTEKQKEKYLLLSNKLVEKGGWDDDLLDDILKIIQKKYKRTEKGKVANKNGKARRRSYLKDAGKFTLKEWEYIKWLYNYRCAICQKKIKLTVDHIIPVSKGGRNEFNNLQPLCKSCNSKKNNKI